MNPLQIFRIAALALLRNKMRSMLTMLGVIIGVAAVIAMVAIGEGAKARVEQAFASMGTNLLIVMPGSVVAGGVQGGSGSQASLTWDDFRAIRSECPSVRYAAPQLPSSMAPAAPYAQQPQQVSGYPQPGYGAPPSGYNRPS